MPKCNRCPIRKECNKVGKLEVTVRSKDGKEVKTKLCPLLFAVNTILKRVIDESKEQSKNQAIQTKEG